MLISRLSSSFVSPNPNSDLSFILGFDEGAHEYVCSVCMYIYIYMYKYIYIYIHTHIL